MMQSIISEMLSNNQCPFFVDITSRTYKKRRFPHDRRPLLTHDISYEINARTDFDQRHNY